ncbi:hypothetical protein ACFY64_13595 [Streptomyces collinus]|uniref:hypothetical protein n=1 Tax=Streptomyces collinus TaxID=42684 RepID=UPI00367CC71B
MTEFVLPEIGRLHETGERWMPYRLLSSGGASGRFEVLGETFTRTKRPGSTWVYDAGGRRQDLAQRERRAFWDER